MTEEQAPRGRRKNAPWGATGAVVVVIGILIVRIAMFGARMGGDPVPVLVMGGLLALICAAGLAVGWLNYFKALRDHRNRRRPLDLT